MDDAGSPMTVLLILDAGRLAGNVDPFSWAIRAARFRMPEWEKKLLAGALPGDLSETHDLINIEERAGEDVEANEPPLAFSSEDL
jgi:hypothetical protein